MNGHLKLSAAKRKVDSALTGEANKKKKIVTSSSSHDSESQSALSVADAGGEQDPRKQRMAQIREEKAEARRCRRRERNGEKKEAKLAKNASDGTVIEASDQIAEGNAAPQVNAEAKDTYHHLLQMDPTEDAVEESLDEVFRACAGRLRETQSQQAQLDHRKGLKSPDIGAVESEKYGMSSGCGALFKLGMRSPDWLEKIKTKTTAHFAFIATAQTKIEEELDELKRKFGANIDASTNAAVNQLCQRSGWYISRSLDLGRLRAALNTTRPPWVPPPSPKPKKKRKAQDAEAPEGVPADSSSKCARVEGSSEPSTRFDKSTTRPAHGANAQRPAATTSYIDLTALDEDKRAAVASSAKPSSIDTQECLSSAVDSSPVVTPPASSTFRGSSSPDVAESTPVASVDTPATAYSLQDVLSKNSPIVLDDY